MWENIQAKLTEAPTSGGGGGGKTVRTSRAPISRNIEFKGRGNRQLLAKHLRSMATPSSKGGNEGKGKVLDHSIGRRKVLRKLGGNRLGVT